MVGLPGGAWLVRAFGVREIAAWLLVLARPEHAAGPSARVAGDTLDIAVLAGALLPGTPCRGSAPVALALGLGVTCSTWCAAPPPSLRLARRPESGGAPCPRCVTMRAGA